MTRSTDKAALAQAVVAAMTVVTGVANAGTLFGGGATLPAPGYVGASQATGSSRLTDGTTTTDARGSLFGAYTAVFSETVSYCQTGSGTGKKILTAVSGVAASNPCPAFSQTATGFGAPSMQTLPDFAASDSPLSAADITNFYAGAASARTAPVQIPALGAAIAIVFNNPDITGTPDISTAQICGVFSGTITNWSQLNAAFPSRGITVAFRSDGSGTSFNFSNYLAAQCNSSSTVFQTNQTWSGGVLPTPLPGNQVGASGNPGVVSLVQNVPGAIGYAEYADAIALTPVVTNFSVNGKLPSNISSTLSLSYTTGSVIATTNNANGTPALQAVSSSDTQPGCLLVVDPNNYSNPSSGYPILAVTYLMSYYSGNGANLTNVARLLGAPYNSSVKSSANQIKAAKGYDWLSFQADPTTTVNACINN
jgi:phosphate transport system substrate-binding protein